MYNHLVRINVTVTWTVEREVSNTELTDERTLFAYTKRRLMI